MSQLPTSRTLFRQEVVRFQQQHRQWGRVVPLQPPSLRITYGFVLAAAAAVLAFVIFAQYARKETVPGYLAPAEGTARIFAPQPGTITAVHVALGDQVREGQPMFSVATEQIAADGQDVNATVLAALARQRNGLQRQIEAESQRGESERARLEAQVAGMRQEIADIANQDAIQRERVRVAERMVASGAGLAARGLVSEIDQRRREEMLLEQKLSLSAMAQQRTVRENQLTEARFTLEQLPTVTAEKLRQLRSELSGTEQRIAEVTGRGAYIVRAPIAGHVSALMASVGQVATPQRLQAQILPEDGTLQAELFIPARAIGFVEVGQDVRILYDAFPYQHYGAHRGRIVSLSRTIVGAAEVAVPVTLAGPSYRAVVRLERSDIDALGKRIALQPDMLLRADVILDRRTLLEWLLEPVKSARLHG